MNRAPRFSLFRGCGMALLLAAWLTLSNHCALALLGHGAVAAESAHLCCAGKTPAGNEKAPSAPAGMCCKSLRALPTDGPAKRVTAQQNVLLFELVWMALSEAPAVTIVSKEVEASTSPPGAESFAELVLQQSLLSHAPPLAA